MVNKNKISKKKSTSEAPPVRIGVISDTHGLLRPEAVRALRNCSRIIHAGDIGPREILLSLEKIAPLSAVRGNNDRDEWANAIPVTQTLTFANHKIFVIHNLQEMKIDAAQHGISVVISGHSHQPKIEWRDGVLYLNPGSAGPRRFHLPVAVAHLRIGKTLPKARIFVLG